jgi:EAL domain-containing protein (putative c-di-GMP-specific phosphodiesterase class I)/GGDEF domain-containing protein
MSIPKPHELLGACGYPARFTEEIARLHSEASTAQQPFGLMLVAINNVAMIISGYGVAVAEQIMVELRTLIAAHLPAGAQVFRVQRDQFGVVACGVAKRDWPALARAIEENIRHYSHASPFGAMHFIASSSYQVTEDASLSAEELLARTMIAMSDPAAPLDALEEHKEFSREEMSVANHLSQALNKKRLRLAYQPVIDSRSGEIGHYEGLLRLKNEDGSITSAGALIPVAERTGLISLLDQFTLETVIAELRQDPHVVLALNVSNVTSREAGWLTAITSAIEQTPEIGPRLIVELTETAIHRDLRHAAVFCAELQSMGCQIALDDFGSGYTSFRQLKSLSIDMVKIDGSFVRDIAENADNRFFVKTMLEFTSGFGLKSVAEFVETGDVAKILMEMGVDYLQGYYFSKPLNYRKWLNEGEYA